MDLRKYKELLFCFTLLLVPSLAGCFSAGSSNSIGDVDNTLQLSPSAEIDQAVLSTYSIQTNFSGLTASPSLLGDLSILNNALDTFADAKYVKISMKIGVFKLSKKAFINHVKLEMDKVRGSDEALKKYKPIYDFIRQKLNTTEIDFKTKNTESIAHFYFDHLLKKHVVVSVDSASKYVDTHQVYPNVASSDDYIVFAPDQDDLAMYLAKDILGSSATEATIAEAKNQYAIDLARFVTGAMNRQTPPDYVNRIYVNLKLKEDKLSLVSDPSGNYRTTTFRLPIGKVEVHKFEIYNSADQSIFAVPYKGRDPIASLFDEGKALPWIETIKKDEATVRPSKNVQVVPMNAISLVAESGSGYIRFGFEALHRNFRYVNVDVLAIASDGAAVTIPSSASMKLKVKYVKRVNGVDQVQPLGGSTDYTAKEHSLRSVKDRQILLLPDYYKSDNEDKSGDVIFTVDVRFTPTIQGATEKYLTGMLRLPFEIFLSRFSTAMTPFDNSLMIEVKEQLPISNL